MTLTPAMQQFYDLKKQVPDALLFFRMGDFYELFDEDAHIAHRVLGISITTRNKNAENPIPLAGIPYHSKTKYLPQLVNAGYKVAIAEQVSDPNLKGIVKREIVRVVTPGTLELEGDEYKSNLESNILLSITGDDNGYGISYMEINSNKWYTGEFINFENLKSQLYKISPKEVILDKKLFGNNELKEILEKKYSLNIYYFEAQNDAEKGLIQHFGVKNLMGYGISDKKYCISSSYLLLEYLKFNQKSQLEFLKNLSYISYDSFMNLDESTIFSLDLIYNLSTKSSSLGTLLGIINKTKTSAGNRMIRNEIIKPLLNLDQINTRLNYVNEFYSNKILLDEIREELSYVSDIDAILNRIALNRTNPRDLLNLKRSLESVINIVNIINTKGSNKLQKIINN